MIYYCKTSFIYDVSVSSFTNKERTGLYFDQSSIQRKIYYHNSNESSASIHICIPPSRYSVAYSRGLSIAKAFKVYSEYGVVYNPSSAFPQSIRKTYPSKVVTSILLWIILYVAWINLISFFVLSSCVLEKFVKAFQSVLPVLFNSCYNLLQVFLSLIFALMKVRNMRAKDITQGKV